MRFILAWILIFFTVPSISIPDEVCKLPKRPYYKKPYCEAGKLVPDAYKFGVSNLCEDTHYDHFISVYQGHCSGLNEEQLKRLTQDPRNLKPMHKTTNLSKGAKDTFEFIKSLKGDKLKRDLMFDYIELKKDYGLTVTSAEYDEFFNLEAKLKTKAATRAAARSARTVKLGKNLLPFDDAVRIVTKRIASRTAVRGLRDVGTLPAQSIPYYGAGVVLSVTAWDMVDACLTMKDLQAISSALNEDEELNAEVDKVCGLEVPTQEELLLSIKQSPSKAVESAQEYLSGMEPIDFDVESIDFDGIWKSTKVKSSNLLDVTSDKSKDLIADAASQASKFSKNLKNWWGED